MALTLISTPLDITVSDTAVASVSITSGITSTYDSYEFHFVNIHPASEYSTQNVFQFQVNATDGADYNDSPITSTTFTAYHNEGDTGTSLAYDTETDQAEGTAYQTIARYTGNNNDQSCSGILTLYAPSSTTYVKHFTAMVSNITFDDYARSNFTAGYINDTTAIDNISFKFDGGNIDAGQIKMYGIAKA